MAKLFVVIGLPGSGKSTRLAELARRYGAVAADDFHRFSLDNRSEVPFSRHYPRVVQALRSGRTCVVADVAFCDPARLAELERVLRLMVPDLEVVREYFANEPQQCLVNVTRRATPEVAEEVAAIHLLAPAYRLPPDVVPRPVVRTLARIGV